ncbi:hypothetical protein [Neobacillus ginsengisoli]|uniref:Uncharacterized protein n=1 Tax=Neobacillus ginsengisoli TaxID=904295 RepID=A0ABT9XVR0_9BACI|nr:hypothetical protein [Neobacillus ginsengisoli]MDQ0199468.1 hypothetical protein [Neobacillus ginsengisoli]
MAVLYGTVEYYERQISDYLAKNQKKKLEEDISFIYSILENEISYDHFLHDEKIRVQFLNNLAYAVGQLIVNGG